MTLVKARGLLVPRPDGELFFANVSRLPAAVEAARASAPATTQAVLLDLTASYLLGIPVIDGRAPLRDHLTVQRTARLLFPRPDVHVGTEHVVRIIGRLDF
jgi:MFS superfamily sulfate permease-like transporter